MPVIDDKIMMPDRAFLELSCSMKKCAIMVCGSVLTSTTPRTTAGSLRPIDAQTMPMSSPFELLVGGFEESFICAYDEISKQRPIFAFGKCFLEIENSFL